MLPVRAWKKKNKQTNNSASDETRRPTVNKKKQTNKQKKRVELAHRLQHGITPRFQQGNIVLNAARQTFIDQTGSVEMAGY